MTGASGGHEAATKLAAAFAQEQPADRWPTAIIITAHRYDRKRADRELEVSEA